MKSSIIKAGAILMLVALTMVNLQFEQLPYASIDDVSISLAVNEADASDDDWYEENLRMQEVECWSNGETISKCVVAPEYLCIVGDQDPCPSEN